MPVTVVTFAEVRSRVVGIITGIITLAVDRVMADPEVQSALLARCEAAVKESILLSLTETDPNASEDPPA